MNADVIDLQALRAHRSAREFEEALSTGAFAQACALAQARVNELQQRGGDGEPELTNALADWALALGLAGDLVRAAEVSLRALQLEEMIFGSQHPRVGSALCRLAQLQLEARNPEDALPLFLRARDILGAALGKSDAQYAIPCSGLAAVYAQQGDLAAAVQVLNEALVCLRAAHGSRHPALFGPLDGLAQLYTTQGNREGVLALRLEAYTLASALDTDDRLARAAALGRALLDVQDVREAERMLCAALATAEMPSAQPAAQPTRSVLAQADAYALLGEAQERQANVAAARAAYSRARALYESTLPAHHPQRAVALMNVALMDAACQDVAAARSHADQALELFASALGLTHPHTQQAQRVLEPLLTKEDTAVSSLA